MPDKDTKETKKTVAKKATAKKTAEKKTTVKKATTKKTAAKKEAAPKKTVAKKATTKKATEKKTTAKKATAKKTSTTTAKKTTVKKKIVKKSAKIVDKINSQTIHYVPQDVDIVRELPERYNETKLVFMVRDPEWSYLYWDISDYDYSRNDLSRGTRSLHIKIFRLSGVDVSKHDECMDIEVHSTYGSWYVMLGIPHCYFVAELGYYNEDGSFVVLAKSNIAYAPRNTVSELYDDNWMSSDELAKALYESYETSSINNNAPLSLSSMSLFSMMNVYTISGLSSSFLDNKKEDK